eukprot:2907120-Lingulodinium_polyedra.AAC.1
MLNQDPAVHPQFTHGRSTLMTLMKHPSLYWNAERLRWLAPSEMLAVHNYPTQAGRSVMSGESSFT